MEVLSEKLDSETFDIESVSSQLNYADEEDDPFINSLWGIHKTLDALRGNMHKRTKTPRSWLKKCRMWRNHSTTHLHSNTSCSGYPQNHADVAH
ncbi:hypothetical protein JTB14_007522 [Gonioctena quinquepunctata]|nr:hypothetical protein JTB14_007522 [Gonioctena quinquepunctata]